MRDLESLLTVRQRSEFRGDLGGRRRWWPVAWELLQRGWTPRQLARQLLGGHALPDEPGSVARILAWRGRCLTEQRSPAERRRADQRREQLEQRRRAATDAALAADADQAAAIDVAVSALPDELRRDLEQRAARRVPRLGSAGRRPSRLLAAALRDTYRETFGAQMVADVP